MRPPRIFYVAPVASMALNRRFGQNHYVGAQDNKVFRICQALRTSGYSAVVVASVLNPLRREKLSQAVRSDDIAYVRVWARGKAAIRRITSAISLLSFAAFTVRSTDRVVLYNFFPEYIGLAALLRLVGNPPILDVEDGPMLTGTGLRQLVTRLSWRILRPLTTERCLVASKSLAVELGLRNTAPIYGVASGGSVVQTDPKFAKERISINFGGAILPGTGSKLFFDAVRILSGSGKGRCLDFHVTGHFDLNEMLELQSCISPGGLRLFIHSALDFDEYKKLMGSCDVGLALKIPSHEISKTTFPSKVVEIANNGLLLCTTAASDVPLLFDNKTAVVLKGETAEELASVLDSFDSLRASLAARAIAGQKLVASKFSPLAVSKTFAEFVLGQHAR